MDEKVVKILEEIRDGQNESLKLGRRAIEENKANYKEAMDFNKKVISSQQKWVWVVFLLIIIISLIGSIY